MTEFVWENKVVVFSASWCTGCKTVKKVLQEKGIEYIEIDIDTKEGMQLAKDNIVRNIPVTVVDGEKYVGSSPELIGKILEAIN